MPETKICTKCLQRKPLELFGKSKDGKYGHKSRCKKCESRLASQKYAAKVGKPIKSKPLLLSWQPQPGDKFDAYLSVELSELCPRGLEECVLNPFVCERNDVLAVISMSYDSRWKLPKSEFIFVRPN